MLLAFLAALLVLGADPSGGRLPAGLVTVRLSDGWKPLDPQPGSDKGITVFVPAAQPDGDFQILQVATQPRTPADADIADPARCDALAQGSARSTGMALSAGTIVTIDDRPWCFYSGPFAQDPSFTAKFFSRSEETVLVQAVCLSQAASRKAFAATCRSFVGSIAVADSR